MKINVAQTIKWYDGKDVENADKTPMTVRDVLKTTCTGQLESDKDMKRDGKLQLDVLSHRFYSCKDEVDLTPEEIVMLKERIEKLWSPRIMGAMFEILDGNTEETK